MQSSEGGGIPAPSQPMPGRSGAMGMGMNVTAVVVSVVALLLAIVIAGPAGPKGDTGANGTDGTDGAQGPQGPAGPGTIMASNSVITLGSPVTIGRTCTHYTGAEVTITVPGPGTVALTVTTVVGIDHEMGNVSEVDAYTAESPNACILNGWSTAASIMRDAPTGTYTETIPALRAFSVGAAGTYTYYLNGVFVGGGADTGYFLDAGLIAVFYPA